MRLLLWVLLRVFTTKRVWKNILLVAFFQSPLFSTCLLGWSIIEMELFGMVDWDPVTIGLLIRNLAFQEFSVLPFFLVYSWLLIVSRTIAWTSAWTVLYSIDESTDNSIELLFVLTLNFHFFLCFRAIFPLLQMRNVKRFIARYLPIVFLRVIDAEVNHTIDLLL